MDEAPNIEHPLQQLQTAVASGNLADTRALLALITDENFFTEAQWSDLIFAAKQNIDKAWFIFDDKPAKKAIFLALLQKLVDICPPNTGFCLSEEAHHACLDVLEQRFNEQELNHLRNNMQAQSNPCHLGYFLRSSKYPSVNSRVEKNWKYGNNSLDVFYVYKGNLSLDASLRGELQKNHPDWNFIYLVIKHLKLDLSKDRFRCLYLLHEAVSKDRIDNLLPALQLLVESHKANVNAVNEKNQTVLDVLASRMAEHFSTLDLITDRNAHYLFTDNLTNYCLAALYLISKGLIINSEKLSPHSKCLVDYVSGKIEFAAFAEAFGLKNPQESPTKVPVIFLLAEHRHLIPETNKIINFCLRKFNCLSSRTTRRGFFDGDFREANVDVVQSLNSTLAIAGSYESRDHTHIALLRNRIALFENAPQTQRAWAFLVAHRFGRNHTNAPSAAFFTMPRDVARLIARDIKSGFAFCSPPAAPNASPK